MNEPLLIVDNVSKQFGGLSALSEVSFTINRGQIYGLIGPNGAGKTTLFNVVTGLYQATSGKVTLDGQEFTHMEPHEVVKLGAARTFQNIRLFANMTALENVMVGRHTRSKANVLGAVFRDSKTVVEETSINQRSLELLAYVDIAVHAQELARHLSYGDQRRLEIARALATEPKLLALDEPAAGMNSTERAGLERLLRRIRDDGVTLLLIEHDVKLVMDLCDRVAVLDYGKRIAEGVAADVQKDPKVIEAYLGVAA